MASENRIHPIEHKRALENITPTLTSRNREQNNASNSKKTAVQNKIPFENAYVDDCYKFIVGNGNNSNLIRNALKYRNYWIEIQPVHSMFNFKWLPTSECIKFARLGHVDPYFRRELDNTNFN